MMSSSAELGNGLRYLLYARDGVGIGHLVRTCALARSLRQRLPRADIAVVSGSPALARFTPTGCFPIQLPPHVTIDPNAIEFEEQRSARRIHRRWRRKLLEATIDEFAPHVMLVDHSPTGKKDELIASVEKLHRRGAAVVLGYRRIAEDSDSIREKLCSPEAERLLTQFYRLVLVYAPPAIREQMGKLVSLPIPQIYTGFVCRSCRFSQPQARTHLRLPVDARVVACALGGGRDAWPLAERIVHTWGRKQRHGWLLLFCGPFLDTPRLVDSPCIRLIRSSVAFPVGIAASDGVITTAGYNSLLEVLRQGRPIWAIPNQETELEQFHSAGLLEEKGFVKRLLSDSTLEDKLEQTFDAILSGDAKGRRLPKKWFQGRRNSVDILAQLGYETLQKEQRCDPPSAS